MQIISRYDKFAPAIRDIVNYPCPVSALPVELLQEIFAFSMTPRPLPRLLTTIPREEREPPVFQITAMILTWVCSQWRHLALSMPELWGTMTIHKPKKFCIDLVKVYLRRSGDSTSLDLSLRQSEVDYYTQRDGLLESLPEHHVTVEILRLWVPQVHRWRLISLHFKCTPPSHELSTILPGAFSRLQEAYIDFDATSLPGHTYDKSNIIQSLWRDIFQSPSLQIAYWHNLRDEIPVAYAPFSQLSELGPFYPPVNNLLPLLPACQRLRRLVFHIPSNSRDVYPLPLESPIVLPALEILFLSSPPLLDCISAPALRRLTISEDYRRKSFSKSYPAMLTQFLQRSCCTLRALYIDHGWTADETPLLEYIHHASEYLVSLEALHIECRLLSEKVVSLFIPQFVHNIALIPFPSLVDLHLETVVARDGLISSMLNSRSVEGAPLTVFQCEAKRGPSNIIGYPLDDAEMSKFQEGGLQLYWHSIDVMINLQ